MGDFTLGLLDCTLRDGGYITEWNWGYKRTREIIKTLVNANIEIIEVGFLRNVEKFNPDINVCNYIEELNQFLPANSKHTTFSAMAMHSNYDISKLTDYNGTGISMIRVTTHDDDIKEGLDFSRKVKLKGYKLSINPINIMGYSDKEILWIIDQVNSIKPDQFSIVDTFGSMKRRDLDRIVSLVDNNLDAQIHLGLHLHENMALSFSLAQNFIDKHLHRQVTIDGSLMGIGRTPGNLPIELIADYLNEYGDKHYDIDYLMDAIQDHIAPIRGESAWGYIPAYFLSAKYNLHRNYSEYYIGKGDLTNRDINHILSRIDKSKSTIFDINYADKLYQEYNDNKIDDSTARKALLAKLDMKNILVIAPGKSIIENSEDIVNYINEFKPIVISVNFIPDYFDTNLAFFCNNKRFERLYAPNCEIIATSNLIGDIINYRIDHNSVSDSFSQSSNSMLLLLKLLSQLQIQDVIIAGADGYRLNTENYYNSVLRSHTQHDNEFNKEVGKAIKKLNMNIRFLTPSAYEVYCK